MPSPLCHWDLTVSDVAAAQRFYGGVFGWRFDDTKFPGYLLIDTGSGVGGGMMQAPVDSPIPALHSYFQVDDLVKTLRAVVEAGGAVIVPRTEIPGVGYIAMFLDPDRIPVGVLEPSKAGTP